MEEITQETRGDVIINRVNLIRATINEATDLKSLLEEQIVLGYSKIIVDLSQCTHLDTTFIGVNVVIHKRLLAKGGELKLVEPLDPAKELFHLTGISKVFNIFETAEEAIQSFNNRIQPAEPKSDDVIPKKNIGWAFA